jgi:hypothetical protein
MVIGKNRKAIGPLHYDNAARIADDIVDPKLQEFGLALDSVQIHVPNDPRFANIFVHERKGWAVRRAGSKCLSKSGHQSRLTCAELAHKSDCIAASHNARQLCAKLLRVTCIGENQHPTSFIPAT